MGRAERVIKLSRCRKKKEGGDQWVYYMGTFKHFSRLEPTGKDKSGFEQVSFAGTTEKISGPKRIGKREREQGKIFYHTSRGKEKDRQKTVISGAFFSLLIEVGFIPNSPSARKGETVLGLRI